MKIGIITHWWCNENYGQQLQCFALQQVLKRRGHQPFLIKYCPVAALKQRVINAIKHPGIILYNFRKKLGLINDRSRVHKERKFDNFKKIYICATQNKYNSYAQLCRSSELMAEAYICGSDQVWNEDFLTKDDNGRPWFLDFGIPAANRVAYAPSFGAPDISDAYCAYIAPLLKKIDSISVRESSGVDICKKALRRDAKHVLDPTLLLGRDTYLSAFAQEKTIIRVAKPYAFFYFLKIKNSTLPFESMLEYCNHLELNKAVVTVYGDIELLKKYNCQPSIPEWVQVMSQADVVFTNSFHGTAFSIVMKRPFVVFPRAKETVGMNSRIESLLTALGLTNRLCHDEKLIQKILSQPIEWESVYKKLDMLKSDSFEFLDNAGI